MRPGRSGTRIEMTGEESNMRNIEGWVRLQTPDHQEVRHITAWRGPIFQDGACYAMDIQLGLGQKSSFGVWVVAPDGTEPFYLRKQRECPEWVFQCGEQSSSGWGVPEAESYRIGIDNYADGRLNIVFNTPDARIAMWDIPYVPGLRLGLWTESGAEFVNFEVIGADPS